MQLGLSGSLVPQKGTGGEGEGGEGEGKEEERGRRGTEEGKGSRGEEREQTGGDNYDLHLHLAHTIYNLSALQFQNLSSYGPKSQHSGSPPKGHPLK